MTILALRRMARLVDLKDSGLERHSERVARKVYKLALSAGWPELDADRLRYAGMVHDVGKIGISESILQKPSRLSSAEFSLIKLHPVLGAEMMITHRVFDPVQIEWVLHHHERPDGRGYPHGIPSSKISHGSALLALADSWDVMISERPYKKSMCQDDAVIECQRCIGTQFTIEAVRALDALCRS